MTYQTKHPPKLRFISAVLALAMLLTLLPTTAFAADDGEKTDGDYTYKVNADGTATIMDYTGSGGDIMIPETLGGKSVTEISRMKRDSGSTTVTSITIPKSVKRIGDSAFNTFAALKKVAFAAGSELESIGKDAFHWCKVLEEIELPSSVKTIGESAFEKCESLGSITLPEGVSGIEQYTFEGCTNLTTVSIPSTAANIGYRAFYQCYQLEEIDIPEGVLSIESQAFLDCTRLSKVYLPKSLESIAVVFTVSGGGGRSLSVYYNGTEEEWKEVKKGSTIGNGRKEIDVVYKTTCTVQFDGNADNFGITGIVEVPPPQIVDIGGYATEPEELWLGGWCTTGWYTDKEEAKNNDPDKKFNFKKTPITEDITLYAGWVKTYYLEIDDVRVTTENRDDVLGDGTARYDPDSNTLKLKNANLHGDSKYHVAIRYTGYDTLTVTGSATLYGDVGIHSEASDLNIENADLTFKTEVTAETVGDADMSIGFTGRNGMTIRDSILKIESAVASGQGVCTYPYISNGDILIQNSNVSVDDGVRCEYGLSSDTILTIDNSTVTIRNANVVAVRGGDNLTISGANTRIIAEINTDTSKYTPIWCKNSIDLQNGLEILENTTQNGVKRMVVGNRANQVFAVMFAMNGHGTQEPAQQVKYGKTPKAPAIPKAEGWYFVGWYADEACTEAAAFGLPIQKETTFYAKWVEKTNQQPYQVHFDLNANDARWEQNFDGWGKWDDAHRVVTAETYSAYHNATERLIQCINMEPVLGYAQPERDGYTFKGWYTAPEGGEKMEEKYDVSMGVMGAITEDLTFYAQWEKIGGEPSNPDKPTEPSNPDKPTEPSNPDKPTEPSNPDKPTEPSNPDKPTEPSNPEKPSTPEDPKQPTTPSEPGKDGGGAGAVILLAGGAALLGGIGYGVYTYVTETQIKALLPEGAAIPANRGELAILLWNAAGRPEPAALPAFADVSDPELAKAAAWCIASGRMTAQEDGTFAPEQRMWKHQVLEVLKKAQDV